MGARSLCADERDTAAENSSWSRGPVGGSESRIGDLTAKEAMEHLTVNRKTGKDRAPKALEFCGSQTRLLERRLCRSHKNGSLEPVPKGRPEDEICRLSH